MLSRCCSMKTHTKTLLSVQTLNMLIEFCYFLSYVSRYSLRLRTRPCRCPIIVNSKSRIVSSYAVFNVFSCTGFFFSPYLGRTYPRSVSQLTSVCVGILHSAVWHLIFSHCSSATQRSFAALPPAHRFLLSHFAYMYKTKLARYLRL
jgi:hypothetical protein